ncbi:MAG: helix-turn-helix domain-containing protein [Bacteroidales bacterium]|nr:helix-turn-helix domain-containing protein [Bacteroidales bacterium]
MNKTTPTFESLPQCVARIEEKLDAVAMAVEALALKNFPKTACNCKREEFIKTKDACKLLGLSRSRVRCLAEQRLIPFYKPGRDLLFKASELTAWIASSSHPAPHSL